LNLRLMRLHGSSNSRFVLQDSPGLEGPFLGLLARQLPYTEARADSRN